MELHFHTIAENLSVSVGTVYGIYKLFEDTGNVDPKIRKYTGFKIDERVTQVILSLICGNPDLYLVEIQRKVKKHTDMNISPPTICNTICKCGLTRKKV